MLNIGNALAVINGVLAASAKFWCECVKGGTCCGGECHCDAGVCCGGAWHQDEGVCCQGTWHPNSDPNLPCTGGNVFIQWGENNACCGCVADTIYDSRVEGFVNTVDVKDEICCPLCSTDAWELPYQGAGNYVGCTGRCCNDGENCQNTKAEDCSGVFYPGCCESLGCPKACCTEDANGDPQCEIVDELKCEGIVSNSPCNVACVGMCCFGCTEPGESGQTTKEQCEALGGFFMGLGTTECLSDQGQCRTPFDEDCCEHVVSSSQRLTFTGPRDKRCPQLSCGFVATVTVSHETPVYVNGGLIGDPYAMCTSATTFFLCNDEFHVTPYPCTEKFHNLDIEVCWSQGEGQNVVPFQCCQNITHLLGNCDCECVTTLLYEGGGCTSNAVLLLLGDAIVDASGTGPLVLTSNIQTQATCLVTLTLQGDNANNNSVQAIPDSASHATSVWKLGTGRWVLNAASDYTGSTTVHKGELVLGVNASGQGQSGGLGSNSLATITIGDAFGVGTASLLLKAGVTVDSRTLTVPGGSQLTVLGGVDTSGIATFGALNLATINVSRNIRLQAATGGTVVFNNAWSFTDATNVTIGSAGNAGTVQLGSSLGTAGAVSVQYGTLQIADGGDIPSAASIHLGVVGASTTAELDYAISGGTISRAIVAVGRGIIRNSGGGTLTFSDTITHTGTELEFAGDAIVLGDITGTGDMTVSGSGSVTINGENTLEGATTISGGSLVIANPPNDEGPIVSATFTHSSLTVYFSGDPDQGSQYALLAGPTIGSYSPTLMGTTATGTYDSSTSTLTIS